MRRRLSLARTGRAWCRIAAAGVLAAGPLIYPKGSRAQEPTLPPAPVVSTFPSAPVRPPSAPASLSPIRQASAQVPLLPAVPPSPVVPLSTQPVATGGTPTVVVPVPPATGPADGLVPATPTAPAPAPAAPGAALGAPQTGDIRRIVTEVLQEEKAKEKAAADRAKQEAEEKGHEVGSDLRLNGTWDNNLFFVSPNKDWRIHLGGRFEFNSVFWRQPDNLKGVAGTGPGGVPVQSGPSAGVGALDDGTYFRRLRLRADGTAYENVEFIEEVNFEQINQITFDHVWVGMKDVPLLGTVRFGQHKVPQGLDMMGSDYYLTFLERSSLSEAFWTLFAPGVFVSNTFFDDNVTLQTMFHRIQPLQFYDGAAFGDNTYAETTRLTWTPYYSDDGAYVVHLGASYQWRQGNLGRTVFPGGTGNALADTQDAVRFRSRAELRDAVGIVSAIGGSAGRFVDTGWLLADAVHTVSPEFMMTLGPLNVRAEAAFAYVHDAQTIYPTAGARPALAPLGNPMFWGGYVQASYFLTGEHWGYDRRFGTYDRPKVLENCYLVHGEDGDWHSGCGAWEIAYRYSFLDLNDRGISGGQLGQHTVGLNWYLNDNTRFQVNYININRHVALPAQSGIVHGLGTQWQWYF